MHPGFLCVTVPSHTRNRKTIPSAWPVICRRQEANRTSTTPRLGCRCRWKHTRLTVAASSPWASSSLPFGGTVVVGVKLLAFQPTQHQQDGMDDDVSFARSTHQPTRRPQTKTFADKDRDASLCHLPDDQPNQSCLQVNTEQTSQRTG